MLRRVPLPVGMLGEDRSCAWISLCWAGGEFTHVTKQAALFELHFVRWNTNKLRLKASADDCIFWWIWTADHNSILSAQGDEPQPATACDPPQEAKALGSFLFPYHQSPQQALTSPCLWHQLLQSIVLEMHWSSHCSVVVSDCYLFKGIIFKFAFEMLQQTRKLFITMSVII